MIDPLVVAWNVLEELPSLLIMLGAWSVTRRLSIQRQSPGLMLASMGFLAKLVIGTSWYLFWWLYLGGVYQLAFLDEKGVPLSQIGWLFYIEGVVSGVIGAASYATMTIMIVYGARRIIRTQTTANIDPIRLT